MTIPAICHAHPRCRAIAIYQGHEWCCGYSMWDGALGSPERLDVLTGQGCPYAEKVNGWRKRVREGR